MVAQSTATHESSLSPEPFLGLSVEKRFELLLKKFNKILFDSSNRHKWGDVNIRLVWNDGELVKAVIDDSDILRFSKRNN